MGASHVTWLTTDEVAEHYKTTAGTVRYWKHKGLIRGVRSGRRTLYSRAEIERRDAELLAQAS